MASNGNWTTRRLGDLCEKIGSGATPRGGASVYSDRGAAFIRSQNIYNDRFDPNGLVFLNDAQAEELRGVEVKPNDVLLNITGDSVARCNRAPANLIPARVSQHVAIIRPRPEHLRPRFLHYLFTSPPWQELLLSLASAGGTRQALTKGMIEGLKVPVPDLAEQTAIEAVLTPLDDKIELNRRTNETLEAMARSLFKSWFVDFDPIAAKAEGKKPFGMTDDIAALFTGEFTDSDQGPIPKGWRNGALGDIAEIVMGTSPPGDTYNDEGRGTPLINGPVEFGDFFPLRKKWTTAPGRFSQNDDLIFCVRGSTTGRTVVSDGDYCLGRGVCSIRAGRNQGFVDLLIEEKLDDLLAKTTGSTFPNLNGPEIRGLKVVHPGQPLLEAFAERLAPWRAQIRANVCQSSLLSNLRDAILPQLLSGEIRLRDAERKIKEVV